MGLGLGRLSALLRTGIGGGTGEEEEEEEVVVLCRCFLSSSSCCGFCWEGGGKPSKRLSPISNLFRSVGLCNLYV